jgi:hypothetical protein
VLGGFGVEQLSIGGGALEVVEEGGQQRGLSLLGWHGHVEGHCQFVASFADLLELLVVVSLVRI